MPDGKQKLTKLILVDGDPILGMDKIIEMKRQWANDADAAGGSIQWIEMIPNSRKNLSEFLNSLDGDAATPDICGDHKILFLRGLLNSKQFREGLVQVASNVANGNTLLVFDETGVVNDDSKQSGWSQLKSMFKEQGCIVNVPPPFESIGERQWGVRFNTEQVKSVTNEMSKRGKKMSMQLAKDVFLEIAMPEWSFIMKELDKLADLVHGDSISQNDISSIVFPWTKQHALFEFANVFNSGDYQAIMDSYDDLIANKIPNDMIFSFCMKLLRWQLIASHLMSYGQSLPSSLNAIASLMTYANANSKTERLRLMKPRLFKGNSDEKENEKKDEGITSFMSKGASSFVKDVFTRRVPIRSGKLGTLPFMKKAMLRYLTMFSCLEEFRLCGDQSRAKPLFRQAMQKICRSAS